jgi:hypothetical protein
LAGLIKNYALISLVEAQNNLDLMKKIKKQKTQEEKKQALADKQKIQESDFHSCRSSQEDHSSDGVASEGFVESEIENNSGE